MVTFGKILNKVLLYINIAFALLLLISGTSAYISPEKWWILALFAIVFSYLFIINLLFIAYWLIQLNKWAAISAIAILLNFGHVCAVFQLPFSFPSFFSGEIKSAKVVKVMSYNVEAFNRFSEEGKKIAFKGIIHVIKSQQPDVICFQEYSFIKKGKYSIDKMLSSLRPLKYYYAFYSYGRRVKEGEGVAILSKYPMVKNKKLTFENSANAAMYADINVRGALVRIYCVHLQSVQLIKENYDFLDTISLSYNENDKVAINKISNKLRFAYQLRACQARMLSEHIQQSPYPSLLCGDFNDTPVSYTYRKMKGSMKDAFREAGYGLGRTFNGLAPSLRIDYIFTTKQFDVIHYSTIHCHYSDHYPICASVILKSN